ncbi:MAG: hypothetical protein WEB30_06595 [Cyclobacteriaceae bacterium]
MKKRVIIQIASCALLSLLSVTTIYWFSGSTNRSGDFYRLYPPSAIIAHASQKFTRDLNYIVGGTSQALYFGHTADPMHVLSLKTSFKDTSTVLINIDRVKPINFYSVKIQIDSPYFYYSDGSIPFLYRGLLMDWTINETIEDGLYFQEAVPVSGSAFIVRCISRSKGENTLGKMVIESNNVDFAYGLLEKQVDGIFCTDGMLHFDAYLHRIIYLYYYRNQYIVADPTLHLDFKGNTIDTFRIAQVKTEVLSLESHKSNRLAVPPPLVNSHSFVYQGWLFVHSNVRAQNDEDATFRRSDIIDVYDLIDGQYVLSFHVPHKERNALSAFAVLRGKLIVLYDTFMEAYSFNPKYFDVVRMAADDY